MFSWFIKDNLLLSENGLLFSTLDKDIVNMDY